jgi:hypothetical protein
MSIGQRTGSHCRSGTLKGLINSIKLPFGRRSSNNTQNTIPPAKINFKYTGQ